MREKLAIRPDLGDRAAEGVGETVDAPVATVLDRVSEEGIAAGYPLGRDYPEHEDGLLIAITERRSREDIDRLADALGRAIGSDGEFLSHSESKSPIGAEVGP